MRVFFATGNAGKVREARAICESTPIDLVTLPFWLGDAETGVTYEQNAIAKAQSAVKLTGMAVLAEDAGLEVDAFDSRPGLYSARFAGPGSSDAANNAKLLAWMQVLKLQSSPARYRAVAALALPSGRVFVGRGVFEGKVTTQPRGEHGFGYDPYFVPEGASITAAEMSPEQKNAISHRRAALVEVIEQVTIGGILQGRS